MTGDNPRPSRAALEAYLVGELAPEQTAVIEAALAADPALAAWVQQRRAEVAAFAVEPRRRPFEDLVAEAERKDHWTRGALTRPGEGLVAWVQGGALAAAAAAALVVMQPTDLVQPSATMRTKGGLTVRVAVQVGIDAPRELAPGDEVPAGARIRLTTESPAGGFIGVLMEDARSVSVVYRPEDNGRIPPGTYRFADSLRLDNAVGPERLYVLHSPTPFDAEAVLAELETLRRQKGLNHGWSPSPPLRLGFIEYTKVP